MAIFFRILQRRTRKITVSALTSVNFHGSFYGKDIHCPKILDELDYGGSASLDMCIMDHSMRWSILAFLDSLLSLRHQIWCKCRAKHANQHKSRVLSYSQKKPFFYRMFFAFSSSKKPWKGYRHQKALSRIFHIKTFDINSSVSQITV